MDLYLLLKERLANADQRVAGWTRNAFKGAAALVTNDGELARSIAVAQVAGSILMVGAGAILGVCDLQFTWATLCGVFGADCQAMETFGAFDKLLSLSAVALAVVFGLHFTDLIGLTSVTRLALTNRPRPVTLCVTALCLAASLTVFVGLADYRSEAMMAWVATEMPSEQPTVPKNILNALAALMFVGLVFAFLSFETVATTLSACFLSIAGVLTGALWFAIKITAFTADVLSRIAATVAKGTTAFRGLGHPRRPQ